MQSSPPFSLHYLPTAIIHIDGDAFFASCEQALHPEYKGKPLITGKERGIVAALSYTAKALGIKRGMRLFEAKQICPKVIMLPSDYETYSLFSNRMFSIMRRFTPVVEEYSIDEAFADITGLRRVLRMNYQEIGKKMQNDLCQELGFTVSLGLASTKNLAKIASKWKKPHGFTCIANRYIPDFLKILPVENIWGVGENTAAYMKKLNIETALDFINKPFDFIKKSFTKPHQEIWHELRGELIYPVKPEEKTLYASISKTKTFTPASKERQFVYAQLIKNVENACIKARKHGLSAKKIGIFLKTNEYLHSWLEAKLDRPSAYPNEIIPIVHSIFDEIYSEKTLYRATGVVLSELAVQKIIQPTLFENPVKITKTEKMYTAIDKIAQKFGKHSLHLASSLSANIFGQHLGERGDLPQRKLNPLQGERGRKRLNIPFLTQKTF